jgi:CrcB protein
VNVWLAVAFGGAFGSVLRYAVALGARALWPAFPWGTLIVNVVGGVAIGGVAAYAAARPGFPEALRLGLITGVIGGFTTFSAFSLDTLLLWNEGRGTAAFANIAANLLLSLAACALGLWLGRAVAG